MFDVLRGHDKQFYIDIYAKYGSIPKRQILDECAVLIKKFNLDAKKAQLEINPICDRIMAKCQPYIGYKDDLETALIHYLYLKFIVKDPSINRDWNPNADSMFNREMSNYPLGYWGPFFTEEFNLEPFDVDIKYIGRAMNHAKMGEPVVVKYEPLKSSQISINGEKCEVLNMKVEAVFGVDKKKTIEKEWKLIDE